MKIGILGKGNVGGALGDAWKRAGHDVTLAGRSNMAEAVRAGEIIVCALPWPAVKTTLSTLDLKGKILIDCTNPMLPDLSGLELGTTTSGGEMVAEWAKGARVVKAFNSTGATNMSQPDYDGTKLTMLYCGDDIEAKSVAAKLIADVGFTPQDAGPLSNSRALEPLAMLWVWLAFNGVGRDFAFQLVKRP